VNINTLKTKVNSPFVASAEANEKYKRVFVYIESLITDELVYVSSVALVSEINRLLILPV